jgi:molybdopterin converting factor small subunit
VKVEVQLFATLSEYRPGGGSGDGVPLDVPDGTTVHDLIRILKIPPDLDCLRVVNGQDAPSDQRLVDGDVVSLFPPLAGGQADRR